MILKFTIYFKKLVVIVVESVVEVISKAIIKVDYFYSTRDKLQLGCDRLLIVERLIYYLLL